MEQKGGGRLARFDVREPRKGKKDKKDKHIQKHCNSDSVQCFHWCYEDATTWKVLNGLRPVQIKLLKTRSGRNNKIVIERPGKCKRRGHSKRPNHFVHVHVLGETLCSIGTGQKTSFSIALVAIRGLCWYNFYKKIYMIIDSKDVTDMIV